jgi:hypothetical protein
VGDQSSVHYIQGQTRKTPVQRCAACCGVEVLLNFLAKLGGVIICNHSSLGHRAMSLSFPSSLDKNDDRNQTLDDQSHQTNHNGRNWRGLLIKDQTTAVRGRFAHATGTGRSTHRTLWLSWASFPDLSPFRNHFFITTISHLKRFVQKIWAP